MSEFMSLQDEVKLKQRLQSFNEWPSPVSYIGLAAVGFRYTGQLDRVQCDYCRTKVVQWSIGDDPLEVHVRLSKDCILLKSFGYRPGTHIPRYVHFSCYEDRLKSVRTVPVEYHRNLPSFASIAKAGFFYQGTLDRMMCYDCGLILKDWEASTDALHFHQRFRPACYFVKSLFVLNNGGVPRFQDDEASPELLRHREVSLTVHIVKCILENSNQSENRTSEDEVPNSPSSRHRTDEISNAGSGNVEQNMHQLNQPLPGTTTNDTLSKSNNNPEIINSQTKTNMFGTGSNQSFPMNCKQAYLRFNNRSRDLQVDCDEEAHGDESGGVVDAVDGVMGICAPNACASAEKGNTDDRDGKSTSNACEQVEKQRRDIGDIVDEFDGKYPSNAFVLAEKQNANIIDELDGKYLPSSCNQAEKQDLNKPEDNTGEPDTKDTLDLHDGSPFDKSRQKSRKQDQTNKMASNRRKNTKKPKITKTEKAPFKRNARHECEQGTNSKKENSLDAGNELEALREGGKFGNVPEKRTLSLPGSCFVKSSLNDERELETNDSSKEDETGGQSSRRTEFGKDSLDCLESKNKVFFNETEATNEIDETNEKTFVFPQQGTRSNANLVFSELRATSFSRDSDSSFFSDDGLPLPNSKISKQNISLPAERRPDAKEHLTLEATREYKDSPETPKTAMKDIGVDSLHHSESERDSNAIIDSAKNNSYMSLTTPRFQSSRPPSSRYQSLPPMFDASNISELAMVKAVLEFDVGLDQIVDMIKRRFETQGDTYPDSASLLSDILGSPE